MNPKCMTALLITLLTIPSFTLCKGNDDLSDSMTKDISMVPHTKEHTTWRGIQPGITRLEDVLDNTALKKDLYQQSQGKDGTVLLFPPSIEGGESRTNLVFRRCTEVKFGAHGICKYIHIGGFFPESRPTLEELKSSFELSSLRKVSSSSRYSRQSSVYNAPQEGLWLIVSNIEDEKKEHQIIAMRYYVPQTEVELPIPRVNYKR